MLAARSPVSLRHAVAAASRSVLRVAAGAACRVRSVLSNLQFLTVDAVVAATLELIDDLEIVLMPVSLGSISLLSWPARCWPQSISYHVLSSKPAGHRGSVFQSFLLKCSECLLVTENLPYYNPGSNLTGLRSLNGRRKTTLAVRPYVLHPPTCTRLWIHVGT